ncbi:hypothetical protein [Caballeronia novacaledonica]|uniref:Uncharacterized protein n=1 Tax=Caballeronia novacaledonica TaxID=1544861 RepID=A0AA37MJG0_9BURK|nr:hypothetical protein [Caballeronia novacaledonica]GJH29955.1 hypothetical protein CBA19CS42_35585 [Caballeronia novacaledonica]
MKSRTGFEICLPILLFGAACVLSVSTLILAIVWMLIGIICLGHREFKSFPIDGFDFKWRSGTRSAILWFYHIAWWLGTCVRTLLKTPPKRVIS